jgi:hypothetical protein
VTSLVGLRMDGIGGGGGGSPSDAVMMIPTPDHSMNEDPSSSRPKVLSKDPESQQLNNTPISLENTQLPHPSQSPSQSSPPRPYVLPPLSSPISAAPPPSWPQTRSPTAAAPSNPFYSAAFRASTPPISSPLEQSPIVSPAKRFSSGEVKPLFAPNSPRQPLNEEDRIKFTQVGPF